jgi:hypothetical protein
VLEVTGNDMSGLKTDITKSLPTDMEIGIKNEETSSTTTTTMKKIK